MCKFQTINCYANLAWSITAASCVCVCVCVCVKVQVIPPHGAAGGVKVQVMREVFG